MDRLGEKTKLAYCGGARENRMTIHRKYTLHVGWKTNKVAKVNSYGSFGLGVEFGTWR